MSQPDDMEIEIKVATILMKKAVPPLEASVSTLHFDEGPTVDELIEKLGLPKALVGSVTVNKRRSGRDRVLENGDRVAIIPAIGGG